MILERLAFEPERGRKSAEPWVNVEGQHVEIRDCSVTGASGDGLRLVGTGNLLAGGEVAASEGCGAVLRVLCGWMGCGPSLAARAVFGSAATCWRAIAPLAQSRSCRGIGSGGQVAVLSQPGL